MSECRRSLGDLRRLRVNHQGEDNTDMDGKEARKIATRMYRDLATDWDSFPIQCYEDLVSIVIASGAHVVSCQDAPVGFTGIQIGDILYVNTSPGMPEYKSLRILAHEWCHWLRRQSQDQFRHVRLYQGRDRSEEREGEEKIARAFERFF